jgi:hypothetical protein
MHLSSLISLLPLLLPAAALLHHPPSLQRPASFLLSSRYQIRKNASLEPPVNRELDLSYSSLQPADLEALRREHEQLCFPNGVVPAAPTSEGSRLKGLRALTLAAGPPLRLLLPALAVPLLKLLSRSSSKARVSIVLSSSFIFLAQLLATSLSLLAPRPPRPSPSPPPAPLRLLRPALLLSLLLLRSPLLPLLLAEACTSLLLDSPATPLPLTLLPPLVYGSLRFAAASEARAVSAPLLALLSLDLFVLLPVKAMAVARAHFEGAVFSEVVLREQ